MKLTPETLTPEMVEQSVEESMKGVIAQAKELDALMKEVDRTLQANRQPLHKMIRLQEVRSYRITVDNLRARVAELEAQLSATIAAQAKQGLEAGLAAAQEGWCDGCSPDNCCGCGPAAPAKVQPEPSIGEQP